MHVTRERGAGRESGSGRAGYGARVDGSEFEGRAGHVGGGQRVRACDWAGSVCGGLMRLLGWLMV
jgi:hypothetical protein